MVIKSDTNKIKSVTMRDTETCDTECFEITDVTLF